MITSTNKALLKAMTKVQQFRNGEITYADLRSDFSGKELFIASHILNDLENLEKEASSYGY